MKTRNEKNVSGCIIEKFRGLDIVIIKYDRKQQTKFYAIDIIYKPVKKYGMILLIGIFQRTWLLLIELSFMQIKKKHVRAFQCYYCNSYYFQKLRYQRHIEKCSGTSGIVYNFTDQNLASFEDNIGNKRDLRLVTYMDFVRYT